MTVEALLCGGPSHGSRLVLPRYVARIERDGHTYERLPMSHIYQHVQEEDG